MYVTHLTTFIWSKDNISFIKVFSKDYSISFLFDYFSSCLILFRYFWLSIVMFSLKYFIYINVFLLVFRHAKSILLVDKFPLSLKNILKLLQTYFVADYSISLKFMLKFTIL